MPVECGTLSVTVLGQQLEPKYCFTTTLHHEECGVSTVGSVLAPALTGFVEMDWDSSTPVETG